MMLKNSTLMRSGTRRNSVTCVCDVRKKYEAKVQKQAKDNLNKVLVMGSVDFKMMYEILKDVDAIHKEKFDNIMKNMKQEDKVEDDVTITVEEDETNENIFLEKN
jgi:hypothetical protein